MKKKEKSLPEVKIITNIAECPVTSDFITIPMPTIPTVSLNKLDKIKRANALTSILSNKDFVNVVKNVDEGEYLLEIFAQAIEESLENMFAQQNQVLENRVSELVSTIDNAHIKLKALENSPIPQVLERLLQNLGTAPVSRPSPAVNYDQQVAPRGEGIMGF